MSVYELTEDQLYELKQSYLCSRNNNASYDELIRADDIVRNEEIFSEYGNFEFSEDDFFSI